jgi:histidinol dehydrogenase
MSLFRFEGPLTSAALANRRTATDPAIAADTAAIIARVRAEGDTALFALAREFDGVALDALEIPRAEWRAAPGLNEVLARAVRNIRVAHEAFAPVATEVETEPGVLVGRRPDPLTRVGIYAPGGRATYPSSLLMGAIPARVAGVGEVIVCSPRPSAVLLAAAALAGVDRVFAVGGAGAIAAMAFGTETIPRVDKIVGPGNAYVAEAKLQLAGVVASEAPAGPSELLIIADNSADSAVVAREALAQAEHDPRAAVMIITLGDAKSIHTEICARLPGELRHEIIAEALSKRGGLLVAESMQAAVSFANEWAPEHLVLAVAEPHTVFGAIRNAGTVLLGQTSSVAFGDYLTGANHVLPTDGLARSYSGLSTHDFVRWTTYQRVDAAAAARLARDTAVFAEAEQLFAHASAARAWETP